MVALSRRVSLATLYLVGAFLVWFAVLFWGEACNPEWRYRGTISKANRLIAYVDSVRESTGDLPTSEEVADSLKDVYPHYLTYTRLGSSRYVIGFDGDMGQPVTYAPESREWSVKIGN